MKSYVGKPGSIMIVWTDLSQMFHLGRKDHVSQDKNDFIYKLQKYTPIPLSGYTYEIFL